MQYAKYLQQLKESILKNKHRDAFSHYNHRLLTEWMLLTYCIVNEKRAFGQAQIRTLQPLKL